MVLDCLPKSPRVDFITDISKKTKLMFSVREQSNIQNSFDLRHKDLSTKRLQRVLTKSNLSNFCLANGRNLNVCKEVHGINIYFAKSEQVHVRRYKPRR